MFVCVAQLQLLHTQNKAGHPQLTLLEDDPNWHLQVDGRVALELLSETGDSTSCRCSADGLLHCGHHRISGVSLT